MVSSCALSESSYSDVPSSELPLASSLNVDSSLLICDVRFIPLIRFFRYFPSYPDVSHSDSSLVSVSLFSDGWLFSSIPVSSALMIALSSDSFSSSVVRYFSSSDSLEGFMFLRIAFTCLLFLCRRFADFDFLLLARGFAFSSLSDVAFLSLRVFDSFTFSVLLFFLMTFTAFPFFLPRSLVFLFWSVFPLTNFDPDLFALYFCSRSLSLVGNSTIGSFCFFASRFFSAFPRPVVV